MAFSGKSWTLWTKYRRFCYKGCSTCFGYLFFNPKKKKKLFLKKFFSNIIKIMKLL